MNNVQSGASGKSDPDFFSDYGIKANTIDQLTRWRKLAELGNAEAMCNLGLAHLDGNATYIDRRAGLAWLRQGGAKGHEFCRYKLAEEELLEDLAQGGQVNSHDNIRRVGELCRSCRIGIGEACVMMAYLFREHPSLSKCITQDEYMSTLLTVQTFIGTLKKAYNLDDGQNAEDVLAGLDQLGRLGSGKAYQLSGQIHENRGDIASAKERYFKGAYGMPKDLECLRRLLRLTTGAEHEKHQDHLVREFGSPYYHAMHLAACLHANDKSINLVEELIDTIGKLIAVDGPEKAVGWFHVLCVGKDGFDFQEFLHQADPRLVHVLRKLTEHLAEQGLSSPSMGFIHAMLPIREHQLVVRLSGADSQEAIEQAAKLDVEVITMMGRIFANSVHGDVFAHVWFSLCNLRMQYRIVDRNPRTYPRRAVIVGVFTGKIAGRLSGTNFLEDNFPDLLNSPFVKQWLASASEILDKRAEEEATRTRANSLIKQNERDHGRNFLPSSRLLSQLVGTPTANEPPPWSLLTGAQSSPDFAADANTRALLSTCPIDRNWSVKWNSEDMEVKGAFEMIDNNIAGPEMIEKWINRDRCPHEQVIQLARDGKYAEAHSVRFRYSTSTRRSIHDQNVRHLTKSYDENHMISLITREMIFRGDLDLAEQLVGYLILTEDQPQGRLHHLLGWIKFQRGKLDEALDVLHDCNLAYETKGFKNENIDADILEYKLFIAELNIRAERLDRAGSIVSRLSEDMQEAGLGNDQRLFRLQTLFHEANRSSRFRKNLSMGISGDSPLSFGFIMKRTNMDRYRNYVSKS
jgi:TPR repeat protein